MELIDWFFTTAGIDPIAAGAVVSVSLYFLLFHKPSGPD